MDEMEMLKIAFTVIIGSAAIALIGIFLGLIYKGIDRKLSAHMQGRIGPPLRQPFYDVKKLFTKENIIPKNAVPWIFNLAPLLGLVGAISILLYLPIIPQIDGGFASLIPAYGDIILILYLLMIPSLAMVIGGFASGSPYATVGAQREMVTMMAYEFPLAIIIISIAWKISMHLQSTAELASLQGITNVFSMATISNIPTVIDGAVVTTSIWGIADGPFGIIGLFMLLFVLVLVTPAELSKIPFDSPEAETEIGGGLLVEYSGRNLGMFYLADGVKTIVMASLIVAIFFPFNISSLIGLESIPALAIDVIFFLIKMLIIVLVSVTLIRVAIARLKIDQIVYTYWAPIMLIALVGLLLLMWDNYLPFETITTTLGL